MGSSCTDAYAGPTTACLASGRIDVHTWMTCAPTACDYQPGVTGTVCCRAP